MDATSVGEIGLDLVVNRNGFDRQMSGIQNLAKKAGTALAGAFAVKKIVDFGKSCLELGSDLAEVQNVVDVTFDNMSEQVNTFAKSAITSAGLSETMAKKFTGTYGAMAKAFGFTESAAYDMSTSLTQLAGDVASFYNLSQDEAYTKLKSVFTGETESLKDLGVVMTQTALDSYALSNGFGRTTSAMSEQEKVALRYKFVMSQLSAAQGDFARTSDSWANQTRIMALQMQSIMASIGQGLINLFTPAIKIINTVLGKIAQLAEAFKGFTELITGKKSESGSGITDLTSGLTDASAAAGDAGSGLANVADSAGNLADTTGAIGDAAKKASKEMKTLMGFDEINKLADLNTGNDAGSGSGGGTSPGSGGIGGGDLSGLGSGAMDFGQLAKGETVVDDLSDSFQKLLDFISPTTDAIKKLYNEGFQKLENFTGNTIKDFWQNFLKPMGEWYIRDDAGLPRFFYITNDLLNEIDWNRLENSLSNFYTSLQGPAKFQWTGLMDFYEHFLKPVSVWTMSEAIPELTDNLTIFNNKVDWEKVNGALANFWRALSRLTIGIGQGAIDFMNDFHVPENAAALTNGAADALNAFAYVLELLPEPLLNATGKGLVAIGFGMLTFSAYNKFSNAVAALGKAVPVFAKLPGATQAAAALTELSTSIGAFPTAIAVTGISAGLLGLGISVKNLFESLTHKDTFESGYEESISDIAESVDQLQTSLENLKSVSDADYTNAVEVLDEFLTLAEKKQSGSLTDSEESLFSEYYKTLTEYAPEMRSKLDEIKEGYSGNREELINLLNTQKEAAEAQGYLTIIDQTGTKLAEAKMNYQGLQNQMEQFNEAIMSSKLATDETSKALETLNEYARTGTTDSSEFNLAFQELERVMDNGSIVINGQRYDVDDLWDAYSNLGLQMEESKGQQDALSETMDAASQAMDALHTTTSSTSEAVNTANEEMADKISNAWKKIKEAVTNCSESADSKAKTIWDKIKSTVSSNNADITEDTEDAWDTSKSSVTGALGGMLLSAIGNMASMLLQMGTNKTIQTNTEDAWDAMNTAVTSTLDAWPDDTKTALDSIVSESTGLDARVASAMGNFYSVGQSAAQSLANGFQSVHIPSPQFSVGTMVANAAGVGFSLPKVNVAWLAQGGFVEKNTPQLAMIGDNRHQGEIVAPEGKLLEMAKMAASQAGSPEQLQRIISLLETLISLVQGGDDIVLAVDSEELARAMITGSLRLKRRHSTVTVTI